MASERTADTAAARDATPADFPAGAIVNGRAHADRLEATGFECEGGKLVLCTDWSEFRRCFEWLADWAQSQASHAGLAPTAAARDVLAERRRQIEAEGWTPEHDDEHDSGELAAAASAYALAASDELHPLSQGDGGFDASNPPDMWCWDAGWWKPTEPRRMLVKAGALILAEIERLDRATGELALVEAAKDDHA